MGHMLPHCVDDWVAGWVLSGLRLPGRLTSTCSARLYRCASILHIVLGLNERGRLAAHTLAALIPAEQCGSRFVAAVGDRAGVARDGRGAGSKDGGELREESGGSGGAGSGVERVWTGVS